MNYSRTMGINIFKSGLLITTTLIILSASCNKDKTKPCLNTVYSFQVTSEWSPQREIYNVGDTIFLNSEFPKILTDNATPVPAQIDYSNSDGIFGDIGFSYLDTILKQPIPAKDSFGYVSLIGNFTERRINQNQGINTKYSELAAKYQFKGGIICKKKGIYWIGVDDLASNGIIGKNCTNAGFGMTVLNSNKHEYLFQNALTMIPTPIVLQRMYCFRVQ
jgi:hypothetical protein